MPKDPIDNMMQGLNPRAPYAGGQLETEAIENSPQSMAMALNGGQPAMPGVPMPRPRPPELQAMDEQQRLGVDIQMMLRALRPEPQLDDYIGGPYQMDAAPNWHSEADRPTIDPNTLMELRNGPGVNSVGAIGTPEMLKHNLSILRQEDI